MKHLFIGGIILMLEQVGFRVALQILDVARPRPSLFPLLVQPHSALCGEKAVEFAPYVAFLNRAETS
jgi:hypothetical protein